MQNRILSKTGVLCIDQSVLLDRYGLWVRFKCDEQAIASGYKVVHFTDDMRLRFYYETECLVHPTDKQIIVIDNGSFDVPYDIEKHFPIIDLNYHLIFPTLNEDALKELPGLDYDHLACVIDFTFLKCLDKQQTIRFCTEGLRTGTWAEIYAKELLERAVLQASMASSHRDWTAVASLFGKAAMFYHTGVELNEFATMRADIEIAFAKWINDKYSTLSGTVDSKRPVLLSKVNDFIRKGNSKIALVVMDGMSFENFFTMQRLMVREKYYYDIQSSFSFFPTVTSVARQSIFSGKLPQEHVKPFSLENEEKQWFAYWKEHGYRANEIAFFKGESLSIAPQVKIVGIVVNICDDLMHGELQGLRGLQQGVENWMRNKHLIQLISALYDNGFSIFLTSDHGNTSAVAEGRFQKPGLLAEPASRRAVIYQSYTDAIELDKFSTFEYDGSYLPKDVKAYLFDTDVCYGERGKEYITHGGMTLEETVVPFIKIEVCHG